MNQEALLQSIASRAADIGIKLFVSLVLLIVSFKVINLIAKKIEKSIAKHSTDKTILRTSLYIFKIGLKILIVIGLIGYLGIDTGGITALIASLGVGIGLAVNGALSDLAGGVLILLTRPFRIDDYIEAQGFSGTVEDIHITNTKLRTPDNKTIYIPNGALSSGTIVNYSLQSIRRVDVTFAISYSSDFKKAQAIIAEICDSHPLILKDPAPFVRISEHAASAISITTRAWCKNADFWTVKFDLLESVKEQFDAEGIEIPFQQVDVHIKRE